MDSALPVQAPNRARARACRRGRRVAAGRRLRPLTGNMRLSAERKRGPARTRQECDEGGNTDKARVRTGLGRWRGMRRVWGRRGRQGTGFTPDDIYSHVRDVALFRGSGPIVMLHSQRVITVASIVAPTHPPSVILRPDSWAGPGRKASASRRRSPHRVPRLRCTGRGLFRPGPEAWGPPGGLRPGGWPDQDRVTRTTRTRPVAARAGPGQCPGEGTTGPGDSDASQGAGEAPDKELANRPSTREHTHTVDAKASMRRRCEGPSRAEPSRAEPSKAEEIVGPVVSLQRGAG